MRPKPAAFMWGTTARAQTIVPVEIVQVGVKDTPKTGKEKPGKKAKEDDKSAGEKAAAKPHKINLNTCDPANPDIEPMPKPPYSENQYTNIAGLYLRAARIAGRFPSITTHFAMDAFVQGHCDPRCFDIKNLNGKISATIGHPAGCTYGLIPSYGTKAGTNNLWWHDKICGGSPP